MSYDFYLSKTKEELNGNDFSCQTLANSVLMGDAVNVKLQFCLDTKCGYFYSHDFFCHSKPSPKNSTGEKHNEC